jgi:molecular chaperone GrpE (heat shock protein)
MSNLSNFVLGLILWVGVTAILIKRFNSKYQSEESPETIDLKLLEQIKQEHQRLRGELTQKSRQLTGDSQEIETLKQQIVRQRVELDEKTHQSTAYSQEIEDLKQQCSQLREELSEKSSESISDWRSANFEQLRTLLTNYPTVCKIIELRPELPAKNLVALFTPLNNLLESWGYQPIGQPWEQVSYNPQLHQSDSEQLTEGELVYVKFVGYQEGDKIICPAKVSRTLSAGITHK